MSTLRLSYSVSLMFSFPIMLMCSSTKNTGSSSGDSLCGLSLDRLRYRSVKLDSLLVVRYLFCLVKVNKQLVVTGPDSVYVRAGKRLS